jgi:hypothetical protein
MTNLHLLHSPRAVRAVLLALAVTVVLGAGAARAAEPFGSLTVDETEQRLKQKNVFAYDCNPPDVFKHSRLPGARWVDYGKLTAHDLPTDKSATLIFYCANEH